MASVPRPENSKRLGQPERHGAKPQDPIPLLRIRRLLTSDTQVDHLLSRLIGMPVSHIWRGYGSALFLEFGTLSERSKRDGSAGDPEGEMSLMIEWSWRIEGKRSILCGSWGDERRWSRVFHVLQGRVVHNASFFGHLPEIEIQLSNGARVISFMTSEVDPAWVLFERGAQKVRALHVRRGRLCIEDGERVAGLGQTGS